MAALSVAWAVQAQEFTITQARYRTGDDPAWSNPTVDDGGWQVLDVTREWTYQGVDNENGYGWYRMSVTLPASMKKADPLKKALVVDLGFVDDADETFLNGKRIGKIGSMPDDPEGYDSKYNFRRFYLVHPSVVRWDKENVIAVRVYNGGDPGGMFGGPVKVRMATLQDLVDISFREEGKTCQVTVSSPWRFKGELRADGLDFETGEVTTVSPRGNALACPSDPRRQMEWTVT